MHRTINNSVGPFGNSPAGTTPVDRETRKIEDLNDTARSILDRVENLRNQLQQIHCNLTGEQVMFPLLNDKAPPNKLVDGENLVVTENVLRQTSYVLSDIDTVILSLFKV